MTMDIGPAGGGTAAPRDRAEIEATRERIVTRRAALLDSGAAVTTEPYTRGVLTALDWVLGRADRSPLTGQGGLDPTDPATISSEQRTATGMLNGRTQADQHGEAYLCGVEHSLLWVLGAIDTAL
jgi:hypothetical protein